MQIDTAQKKHHQNGPKDSFEFFHVSIWASLSPTIPMMIKTMDRSRMMCAESPKNKIPQATVPAVPIPAHTAYAVPIGIVFIDWETQKKLKIMKMPVMMLGMIRENPKLNFKAIVKQISKNPARKRKNQEIDMKYVPYGV